MSGRPAISADGRFVAFSSDASNLVAGDTNGRGDIFVRDRLTGTTERLSLASDGTQANRLTSISADGRFVTFSSSASNLVAGDTNRQADVFVHDRLTSTTERVSVASDGTQANGDSSFPSISADGRFVTFVSRASTLVAGDTNSRDDVFVHDRQTGTTERVSVASDGTQGNRNSRFSSISADGRFVKFDSAASNLVAGDTNFTYDIFVVANPLYDGDGPVAMPPTGNVLITGLPETGSTLRADTLTIADANGLGTFSYQWFAGGDVIEGANSDSFTPMAAQIGRKITVRVSYTDGIGTAESLTSAPSAAVRLAPQINDPILGMDGPDRLIGGVGRDQLFGGAGNDMLYGDDYVAAYDMDLALAIYRLYQATLNRPPDTSGQANWTEQLGTGMRSLIDVAEGFTDSQEFLRSYGGLDDAGFVTLLYQNVLARAPDAGGLAGWVARLEDGQSRPQVVLGFSQSLEFVNATNAAATQFILARDPAFWQGDVFRLYLATLGRAPDLAGFQGWAELLAEGTPLLAAVAGFVNSPEFQNTYGTLDNIARQSG